MGSGDLITVPRPRRFIFSCSLRACLHAGRPTTMLSSSFTLVLLVGGRSSRNQEQSVSYNEHDLWGPGPEAAESAKLWRECKKNPGHNSFIPVGDFRIHHLPERWQREEFVELIKAASDLTVRLRVPDTSPCRPDHGIFSACGGGQRVGTGFVDRVESIAGPCPCEDCINQQGQNQMAWAIYIGTAQHVVYDDNECKTTYVDFFHDYDGSKQDGKMKTLMGKRIEDTREDSDWCRFTCVCHDGHLALKLMDQVKQRTKLEKKLDSWWGRSYPIPEVIVSHPHGRPKHVTVGEFRYHRPSSKMWTYTTDTCPGSSGARMVVWWGDLGCAIHHCQGGGQDGLNKGFWWCES